MSDQARRIESIALPGSALRTIGRLIALTVLAVATTGCSISHRVTFKDAQYVTDARKNPASVVAVIDQDTLARKVVIKAWLVGYGNDWETEPGDMLKQVADIELPQMFSDYQFSTQDRAPSGTGPGLILALSVPQYRFADLHATLTVHAICKARDGRLLFEKSYVGSGPGQGNKMVFGGAFGMKSAIRQSSLAAYKQAFAELRVDLQKALDGGSLAAR